MQVSCNYAGVDALIRKAGLRRTVARQAILEALTSVGRPMTHQQIAVRLAGTAVDKVTIYRTLTTLRKAGLLHVVHGADGTALFCPNTGEPGCPGGHPHFQCQRCGEMRCIREQSLPRISLGRAAVITAKQLMVFGVCARCARLTRARDARAGRRRGKSRS